ncbi:MAG: electron transfer flavoprotein subunit alpha/FixB family protein [Spirochaetes bacterium]|nr:MAG: electron transfer flavoprotein subunit alpha/FixB family protein [Spirochaetota bacterium]
MARILVVAEQRSGKLSDATLELCKAAKAIASAMGAAPAAAVFYKDDSLAKEVAKYIPEVFSVVDAKLEAYNADTYTEAVKAVVAAQDVKGVLIPHSYDGVDYAAKAALAIGAGIVSNCNKFEMQGGTLVLNRNTYNGKIQEQRSIKTDKFVVTFEKGAFDKEAAGGAGSVTAVAAAISAPRRTTKEIVAMMAGSVDISQAKIIVAGGRGTKEKDKYNDIIVNLAKKLGGEYAASRPVVDAGWTDAARQVGQSGKTVAPVLYIAAGISGAIQHVAGMKGSQCIVAINKDPEAPVFNIATYGIVGDLFEVIPAIMAELG